MSVTFNCSQKIPTAEVLTQLLQPQAHDIYTVALQNLDANPVEMEAALCMALGEDYLPIRYCAMHGLHLLVAVHLTLLPLVEQVESDQVSLGVAVTNQDDRKKGAVAVSFRLCDRSFVFVNAHLRGKANNVAARNANYHEINARLKLPNGKLQTTEPLLARFDFAFWMGDLNFRVGISPDEGYELLEKPDFEALWRHDQLLNNRSAFQGFSESVLNFPPTFKYIEGSDMYSEKSFPSWTDRILHKTDSPCEALVYDAFDFARQSTHRPVFAVHRVELAEPNQIWDLWHARQELLLQHSSPGRAQAGSQQFAPGDSALSLRKGKDGAGAGASEAAPKSKACSIM